MKKLELIFGYFSIFYLLNYLWIEKYLPLVAKFQIVNMIIMIYLLAILINIPYLYYNLGRKKQISLVMCFFFIILILLGLISSGLYGYQNGKTVLLDTFLFSRFMIIFLSISLLIPDNQKDSMKKFFITNLKCLTIINFILLMINLPLKLFPSLDIRFGFPTQQLIYPHPTYLATISFLAWVLISGKNKKSYQLLALLLMLSTMRTKIIVLVFLYLLYHFFLEKIKSPATQLILGIIGFLSLTYTVFGDIIYTKLLNQNSSVRANIMSKAFEISKDHFPFGSGLATFGSYTSFINYSPIYSLYGLSNTYGFLNSSYQYGMDSYISMILAQFGIFGVLFYIIVIFSMLYGLIKGKEQNNKHKIELLALFLIISCFTESIINTGLGIVIFSFLALSNTKTPG